MRRRLPAAVGLLAAILAAIIPLNEPAGATTSVEKLRQQQRAVKARRAAQASQINVLQADNTEIGQALDALEVNRRATAAEVASARQHVEAEKARAAAAKAAQLATQERLTSLRTAVRDLAIAEYMRGGQPDLGVPDRDLTTPMETARRRSLLTAAMGTSSDATDRLQAAEEDLDIQRRAAEEAQADAEARQREVESKLAELEAATEQQEALAAQVEERLERALAEADSLAAVDSAYASRIASEQAAIARRLRSSTGRVGRTTVGRVGRVGRIGNVSLATVRGIVVASSIASNLSRLLAAADADGVSLSGGGFRDPSQQIATRRNNCGSSDYDIYQKPASACSPPTARPGRSMHERGLAIDFTSGGRILTRSSAGYRWLKANASSYGFYNLPSEPWHWSVNGD